MATPITQMRLTDEDKALMRTAIRLGRAKTMTEAVQKGIALLVADVPLKDRVRPTRVKSVSCRMCRRPTKNECGICDRHTIATNTGLARHNGALHVASSCPLKGARKYR